MLQSLVVARANGLKVREKEGDIDKSPRNRDAETDIETKGNTPPKYQKFCGGMSLFLWKQPPDLQHDTLHNMHI